MKAFCSFGPVRHVFLFIIVLSAVLGSVDVARSQNFLKAPVLGKSCSQEGLQCTDFPGNKFFNFVWSITNNVRGRNFIDVMVLKSSNLDPNTPQNWVSVGQVESFVPSSTITLNKVSIRSMAAGDSWRPGGLARVSTRRFDASGNFFETLPARFRDVSGIPRPYPENWNISGHPLSPLLDRNPTQSNTIIVLSDDSVTPADQGKPGQFLTKGTGFNPVINPEKDTDDYYDNTCTYIPPGSTHPVTTCSATSNSIRKELGTLTLFKLRYGMAVSGPPKEGEHVAKYYNRGDLGIGRNMHCKYKDSTDEFACYVKNYCSDLSPNSQCFGVSSALAFKNMDEDKAFATVAMVARRRMDPQDPNKVIFMVYGPDEKLQNTAALDRHARNPDKRAIKGIDYNRHIPGNCMVCHGAGGHYNNQRTDNPGAVGAMFLPFDLDNFQYHPTDRSLSRTSQEQAFKDLNTTIVWPIADDYKAKAITNNIEGWYNKDKKSSAFLSNTFLSGYVPDGWREESTYGDKHFYQRVLRPYCSTCHQTFTNTRNFESVSDFNQWRDLVEIDVCPKEYSAGAGRVTSKMPQAEQVSRLFWQSDARGIFVGYMSADYYLQESGKQVLKKGQQILECMPGPNLIDLTD